VDTFSFLSIRRTPRLRRVEEKDSWFDFPFFARSANVNEQSAPARCELTQEESKSFINL